MPRGTPHSPEIRAAVLADMAAGMSATAAARKHGVSTSRAQEWRQQAQPVAIIEPKKALDLGELVALAVTDALAALSAVARHATDKAWLNGQSADELAILYGVLADKTVRVLGAAERSDEHNEAGLPAIAPPGPATG